MARSASSLVGSSRPEPAARRAAELALLLALTAALALVGTTGWSAPASSPSSSAAIAAGASPLSDAAAPAHRAVASPIAPAVSANCSALTAGWSVLGAGRPAPPVLPSLETPCVLDPDSAGLYLTSNATNAGARTEFSIALPLSGTTSARDYSTFWIGMWLGGVDCSYGAASYLTIELIPPYSASAGVSGSPDWTVAAPVWDLVPAGSCDPGCQNSTAFFTIAGRGFCEDDAVIAGFGALNTSGEGALAPGDAISLTLDGVAGGPAPLAVYLNDTTHPGSSLAWNYSAGTKVGGKTVPATITSTALYPLYANASRSNGGWTGGLDVGLGYAGCPAPAGGTSFAAPCVSYGGAWGLAGSPQVFSVASFNATAGAYSNPYPELQSVSSSGACALASGMPSCADFTSYGGAGIYPVFGLGTGLGRSWITFAPAATAGFFPFAPVASEFPANGTLSASYGPAIVGPASASVGPSSATISFRASDPLGTAKAWITTFWCASASSTAVETTYPASLTIAPGNSPADGNWSAPVATNGLTGTMFYWTRALAFDSTWSSRPIENVTIASGSGGCGATTPPAPKFNATDIVPIGGGYALTWTGNASAGTTAYTVIAKPVHGGTTVDLPEGNATAVRVVGLSGNVSYNLTVVASNPLGLATPSAGVTAPMTLYPLAYKLENLTASSPWAGSAVLHLQANMTGGLPPYHFDFSFGDGTPTLAVWVTSDVASATHTYPANYSGVSVVTLTVIDSAGDTVTPAPIYVPIQGPPLAVPATIVAGSDFVQLRWTPPVSHAPLLGYKVLWTTDPAGASYLTAATPANASFAPIGAGALKPNATRWSIAAPEGTAVYAEVVGINAFGEGLLPSIPALGLPEYLTATPTPFSGELTASTGGGPAPLPVTFNATFALAPGDALTNATYRFAPGGGTLPAEIGALDGVYWANGSTTFDTPGLVNVYLYVEDAIGQATTLYTTVYVAPGAAPLATITVGTSPVWANASVEFTASASGGSGSYRFLWGFGDGTNATGNPVNTSFLDPGTYLVSVVVNDTVYGGTTTASIPITVYGLPTVAIAETSTGTYGTYRFTAIPHGGYGALNYTWLFGDGSSATGAVANHSWALSGNYSVTLQASDGYGHTATATISVLVPVLPSSGGGSGGSTASESLEGALVIAVIALAIVVALLLVRLRRRPPPAGAAEPGPAEAEFTFAPGTVPYGEGEGTPEETPETRSLPPPEPAAPVEGGLSPP